MKSFLLTILIGIAVPVWANAQEQQSARTGAESATYSDRFQTVERGEKKSVSISTNLFDWGDMGTINLEAGVAVSRHLSLQADVKYNPWEFESKNPDITQMHNKQKSAAIGLRYWPWYVFSGWWMCAKAQYTDYSITGLLLPTLDIGKAVGGGLSAGYTFMLTKSINIEAGAGLWGGKLLEHTLYHSPNSTGVAEQGPKWFVALNDIRISVQVVF